MSFWVSSDGATYYVATDGNDSALGTIAAPWLTFKNVASNTVKPGDTVLVRGGTYSAILPGGDDGAVISFPFGLKFQGDPNNPLIVKPYPNETVIIDPKLAGNGIYFQTPTQGVLIEGLTIQNSRGAGVRFSDNPSFITIRGNEIRDTDGSAGGNIGGIVFNSSNHIFIENNRIHGNYMRSDVNNENNSDIFIFSKTNNITIRNNELYDSVEGVFYKHSNAGDGQSIFENNFIHDIRSRAFFIASNDITMRNNLVVRAETAFLIHEEAGCTTCSNRNIINHNTVVESTRPFGLVGTSATSGLQGAAHTQILNNIFVAYRGPMIWSYGSDAQFDANTPDLHSQNNEYFVPSLTFDYFGADNYGPKGAVYTSIPGFQALKIQFPENDFETNSFNADPLFVDPANGDYHLKLLSPARGKGILGNGTPDNTDLGADIDNVGPPNTGTTQPPPARPRELRIR